MGHHVPHTQESKLKCSVAVSARWRKRDELEGVVVTEELKAQRLKNTTKMQKWRDKYRERNRANQVAWGKKNKLKVRDGNLRARLGITLARWNEMFQEQNGECAICNLTNVALVTDHNHSTGKVRGLLCISCNSSLGFLEKEGWADRAFKYLERTK